tara:strand:- start:189 stop:1982 length:1794 start_codon:yes stop_codon:yes gene_type:complete
MKKYLILTNRYSISEHKLTVDRLLLLGEWCKLSKDGNNDYKRIDTVPYHWADRTKRMNDSIYLNNLYENVLDVLVGKLNKIHKLNFSKRSWRIFIGPWLATYLSVVFDRWEIIKSALNNNKDLFFALDKNLNYDLFVAPLNFEVARDMYCYSQEYNEILFTRVLDFKYSKMSRIYYKILENKKSGNDKSFSRSYLKVILKVFKTSFRKLIEKFNDISNYIFRQKIILYRTYFDRWSLILLFLKFRQIPNNYPEFKQEYKSNPINYKIRSILSKGVQNVSEFESFFWLCFGKDVPKEYLEDLKELTLIAKRIKYMPKIIFTANAHWGNAIFKFWTAYILNKNDTKLIISTHGGGFPLLDSITPQHESLISDLYLSYSRPKYENQLQVPSLKRKKFTSKRKNNAKFITLIGSGLPPFAFAPNSMPMSSLILHDFEQKIKFCDVLVKRFSDSLRIRPYPDQGWGIADMYCDRYGKDIINSNKSYSQSILESKLIICSYPQTTYSEALSSGKPTLLLFKSEYWELDKRNTHLIKKMMKANMIFDDPYKAANHVKNIEADPNEWWNSKTIQELINEFNSFCYKKSLNPLLEWEYILRNSKYI